MPEEVQKLVDKYQLGEITRRQFIRRVAAITGSIVAATSLLESLGLPSGYAAVVDPKDPSLVSGDVQYKGKAGNVFAYLSRPKASGTYPGLIVIHENRGLNDHILDVARRFAKEGYVALAPDYLSRHGGTKKVNPEDKGLRNMRKLATVETVVEDTESGFAYLQGLSQVQGDRLGLTGFCWGGEMTFACATEIEGLEAAVVYYGRSPKPLDKVKNIEAPVLAHYGETDKGVNAGIADTEAAMKKYDKSFSYKIHPGAGHAFNNDTRSDRYHAEAAKEAWDGTLAFFKKHLRG